MRALVLRKYKFNNASLVERTLPHEGEITVKEGDVVQSFDRIGHAIVSDISDPIDWHGTFLKKEGDAVSKGEVVWNKKSTFIKQSEGTAPFSGFIVNIDTVKKKYSIKKVDRDYTLISGVAGKIADIIKGRSVLLSLPALEVSCPVGKGTDVSGELVVLGVNNKPPLFEWFNSSLKGKIVACSSLTSELYAKGKTFGVAGFITGSIAYGTFAKILDVGPSIVVTEGFGYIPFSYTLFEFLKKVQSRFVILRPQVPELVVPTEDPNSWPSGAFEFYTNIEKGQIVQIFDSQYYGKLGTVFKIGTATVSIKLLDEDQTVEVAPECLAIIG